MQSKLVKHLIFPLHEKILGRGTYKFLERLQKEQFLEREALEALKFQKGPLPTPLPCPPIMCLRRPGKM